VATSHPSLTYCTVEHAALFPHCGVRLTGGRLHLILVGLHRERALVQQSHWEFLKIFTQFPVTAYEHREWPSI